MKVVAIIAPPKQARRGQRALKKYTLLWCIEYENGKLFTYSYYRKTDALKIIETTKNMGTNTQRYMEFNMVDNVQKTLHIMPQK